MDVRQAREGDGHGWVRVISQVAAERDFILTESPVDEQALHDRFLASLADEHVLRVAVDDEGDVVGTAGLHPGSAPGVWSLGMCLISDARGRGLGSRLLDALLEAAHASAAHKVELGVYPRNGRAVALYASRGFVVEGLLRGHHRRADGELRDVLVMGLPLS